MGDGGGHGLGKHLRNVRARFGGCVDGGDGGGQENRGVDLPVGDRGAGRHVVGQDLDAERAWLSMLQGVGQCVRGRRGTADGEGQIVGCGA